MTFIGTADERAAAFASYRAYVVLCWRARYGIHSYPDYDADGRSPEMSRRLNLGNYDRTARPMTHADHMLEERVAREASSETGTIIARKVGGVTQRRARFYPAADVEREAAQLELNLDRALAKDHG